MLSLSMHLTVMRKRHKQINISRTLFFLHIYGEQIKRLEKDQDAIKTVVKIPLPYPLIYFTRSISDEQQRRKQHISRRSEKRKKKQTQKKRNSINNIKGHEERW